MYRKMLKISHRYMRMKRVCDLAHRVLEGFGKFWKIKAGVFGYFRCSMHFDDTNATFNVFGYFDDTNATFDVFDDTNATFDVRVH